LAKPSAGKPLQEIDTDFYQTPNHPAEAAIPHPEPALVAAWRGRLRSDAEAAGRRMDARDLYDLIQNPDNRLRTPKDVWRLAEEQDRLGNKRLLNFLLNRKDLAALFGRIQLARSAPADARRQAMTRMQILEEARRSTCTCTNGTDVEGNPLPAGTWCRMAMEICEKNLYRQCEVEKAILQALQRGRMKKNNVWFLGGPNRGKTFLLLGIGSVFNFYEPPDTGSYQLEDIGDCEVILLNEFKWSKEFCPWWKCKELMEGKPIKIGVRKTGEGRNYMWHGKGPVFGASREKVCHPKDQGETAQMDCRLKYFELIVPFDPEQSPDLVGCPRCVAEWLLSAQALLRAGAPRCAPPPPPAAAPPPPGGVPAPSSSTASSSSSAAAPPPPPQQQGGWYLEQGAGTYRGTDLPGQCFFCGAAGHDVRDCERKKAPQGAVVGGRPAAGTTLAPPQTAASRPFCGMCGERMDATPFCTATGVRHA